MKKLLALLFLLAASQAHALYYCKCGTGAHASCVAGSDSNDGSTAALAKSSLFSDTAFNSAAAGAQFRLCEGGVWPAEGGRNLENMNATVANPIIVDSYAPASGATGRPIIEAAANGTLLFVFGDFNNTTDDKGYIFRGLYLKGTGSASTGMAIASNGTFSHALFENMRIEGFYTAIYWVGDPVSFVTVKDSIISNNVAFGIQGGPSDVIYQNITFEGNNPTGTALVHPIYYGSTNTKGRATIRGNRFINNAGAVTCAGGNLTTRGRTDQMVIEDNVITVAASSAGCYGISLVQGGPGYTGGTPDEYQRRLVIRNNTIVGVGNNYITVVASTNAVVENNRIISNAAQFAQGIIVENGDADDEATSAVTVRNNSCYFPAVTSTSSCVNVSAGSNHILTNNVVYFGASAASTVRCFGLTALSNFTLADRNHCYFASGSGNYTDDYATLGLAQAAGMGANDSTGDPLFATTPSSGNSWSLAVQSGSPVRSTGHTTHKAKFDVLGCLRDSTPDKGAHEFGGTPCSDLRAPVLK